jgi:multiple sugar transport system permease protein
MTSPITGSAGRRSSLAPSTRRKRSRRQVRFLFVIPAAVFIALFSLFPLIQLVRMSMSDVTPATLGSSWNFTGLTNFVRGFAEGTFGTVFGNTVVFVGIVTVIGLLGGLASAIALRGSARGSGLLLGLMVFIWALPPVVNGSVWKFLLGNTGLFNSLFGLAGAAPVGYLYDQHLALFSVAIVNSWAVVPFNALVFRAAILNIPAEIFEAAQLDGARPFQEIRHVIMPAVRPTTLVLTVLTVVYGFRSFDFIYVMTYGGPGTVTTTLPFLSYLQAFVRYDFGLGSATAVITVVLVTVLAVVYARSVRREELDQ